VALGLTAESFIQTSSADKVHGGAEKRKKDWEMELEVRHHVLWNSLLMIMMTMIVMMMIMIVTMMMVMIVTMMKIMMIMFAFIVGEGNTSLFKCGNRIEDHR